MTRVLLSGFGFMGRIHARVLRGLSGVEIAGVADPRGEEVRGALREEGCAETPLYTDLKTALQASDCDAVDLCVPTDLHRAQAGLAFACGKHVFCEKPLALNMEDAEAMVAGAEQAGVYLMVGQCIRFWPEYRELERVVRCGELGALRSLSLTRLAGRPGYTVGDWVGDPARCVGAALDLHIHDVDFVHGLLGVPKAVTSRGVRYPSGWDHITTLYDYDGLCVSAEGGWDHPSGWGFRMGYHAVFDGGTLDFESTASPALTRCLANGKPQPVIPPVVDAPHPEGLGAYAAELDHFLSSVQRNEQPHISTGRQAAESLRVVLAEIESAASGHTVKL